MIVSIYTPGDEARIQLLDGENRLHAERSLPADKTLSSELPKRLREAMADVQDTIEGIVVFSGPGSFTSLRIGHTVANALAYALGIPVASAGGDRWIQDATAQLSSVTPGYTVAPEYGAEPNITKPKK